MHDKMEIGIRLGEIQQSAHQQGDQIKRLNGRVDQLNRKHSDLVERLKRIALLAILWGGALILQYDPNQLALWIKLAMTAL